VASRVGSADGSAAPTFVDTVDLVGMLEATPPIAQEDRWVYTPAERIRILQSLLVADGSPWIARFGFLLAMSVVIATLGLANNQPAAVIAAMVVAPLMTPVLGIAAALTLGLPRRALRLTAIVLVSSLAAVALGWLIATSLVVHEVTPEELSRTTPRLRDLAIAAAAGSAGMYSVVRKDLSGVVPGVAIAVALVPPLATVGILVERREWALARGATLLYGVNVVAIVIAAIAVLLATDFMASPSARQPRVAASGIAIVAVALAVVLPVWQNSRRIDREVVFATQAADAVATWAEHNPRQRVVSEHIEPGQVRLVIAGLDQPSDLAALRRAFATSAYPRPTLEVDWIESAIVSIGPDD
jgi:uncharacterized hydrophobic protein (TIGR00271 family)